MFVTIFKAIRSLASVQISLGGVEKPKGRRGRKAGSKNKKTLAAAAALAAATAATAAAALTPAGLAAAGALAAATAATAAADGTPAAPDTEVPVDTPATLYGVQYEDGRSSMLTVPEVELEPDTWLVWDHTARQVSIYAMHS